MNDLEVKSDAVSKAVLTFENMMKSCPNPTQSEIRKLLAIQGYILNAKGMEILSNCVDEKGKLSGLKSQTGMKMLAASREALKSAANISDKVSDSGEVIDVD